MEAKEREKSESGYITAEDLADDLYGYVKEFYCGAAERRQGGFVLRDVNGREYEVSVREKA